MSIILASQSPRRAEILKNHGIEFVVIPADVDESLPEDISMEDAVKLLALKKAEACYELIKGNPDYKESIIIAADTVVYKDGIMGKPLDKADAHRMISLISGTDHYVATGVAIISTETGQPLVNVNTGEVTVFCDITRVWCKHLSEAELNEYIASNEPYDKAGAYAIQGSFGKYIDRIDGDFENVVGLPYHRLEPYLD